MNKQETCKIMVYMQAEKPHSFTGLTAELYDLKIELWQDAFSDVPYKVVFGAVRAFMMTDVTNFAPGIGQINDIIYKYGENGQNQMTGEEAWNGIVLKALRNSTYNAQKEFDKLPNNVKKLVSSPATLRNWGLMDTETLERSVKHGFVKSYSTISDREKETNKIAPNIRKLLGASISDSGNSPKMHEIDIKGAVKRF